MGWLASFACSILLYAAFIEAVVRVPSRSCHRPPCIHCEDSVYNYTLSNLHGTRNISLSEYQGKVLLIVNVATY
ncbi:hypothetical protein JTE90_009148 [Oedothorax gibbosus]|uniref:Glutathione peroxidase n=1 Tax=Oedothorax gibbosus TaxID=931172 RepID=A0AAV6TUV3_9ARAC|nr:hypothetical protein JTE90_009148 [Oedothorax gibbosus]